jgi:hypothetical protein
LSQERSLVGGDYDGPYSYWAEDGRLMRRGRYENGKEEGVWAEWDSRDGRLAEHAYKGGEPWEGVFDRPAPAGSRRLHLLYRDGRKIGEEVFEPEALPAKEP